MSRYVPRTYKNRRIRRIILRTITSVLLVAAALFIALFFWLDRYLVFEPGEPPRLVIPWLMADPQDEHTDTDELIYD